MLYTTRPTGLHSFHPNKRYLIRMGYGEHRTIRNYFCRSDAKKIVKFQVPKNSRFFCFSTLEAADILRSIELCCSILCSSKTQVLFPEITKILLS